MGIEDAEIVEAFADLLERDGAQPTHDFIQDREGDGKRLWLSNSYPLPRTMRARLIDVLADAVARELLRRRGQSAT